MRREIERRGQRRGREANRGIGHVHGVTNIRVRLASVDGTCEPRGTMERHPFEAYELRTTDLDAAAEFYREVLGAALRSGTFFVDEQPIGALSRLPERAAAAGAPAHWLGHVGADDPAALSERLLAQGFQQLPGGVLRDPFGAVLAIRPHRPRSAGVRWHHLHTRDLGRAWAAYAPLGWASTNDDGRLLEIAFGDGEPSIGMIAETANLPGVHVHWLFFFGVRDFDRALGRVRANGGISLGAMELPDGTRIAPCDDVQGAAFGLYEIR